MSRNYKDTIQYLYERLPMFQRIGDAAIKKDLHNTRVLCAHHGHPELQFKSIHIAGSNGKGSVSHMLAAAFQSAGYKTGLYTSPHLKDFRERIRVDGEMIPEASVIQFVENTAQIIETLNPSFFEVTVAMAFDYFASQKVDIAIIETGLGGRLDSTNVITPQLAVITNISLEHTQILGDTLEAIAGEKGGIIKQGVPVVIGRRQPETEGVFRKIAREKSSTLHFSEDINMQVVGLREGKLWCTFYYDGQNIKAGTDQTAAYQAENLRTVICALLTLNTTSFPELNIPKALSGILHTQSITGFRGRWQVIGHNPKIVLDGAHNPDGVRQIATQLNAESYRRLHIVIGTVRDKDTVAILRLLPPEATYYFTQPDLPRALYAVELKELAEREGRHGLSFTSPQLALQNALSMAGPEDLVLVTGSLFLVAEFA